MPFFDLDEQERRSFLSVVRHTVLEGELRLVRFTDSTRGHEAAFGRLDPKTGLYGQRASGRKTDASYPGGSIQLVTRLSHQECRWVSGPIRTLDLSSTKLAGLG